MSIVSLRAAAVAATLAVASVSLSACGHSPGTRALTGGAIGAGSGAIIGGATGVGAGTGALVGAGVGAAGGAATAP
jgi:osmotically inducible lipoprotein OsmB